MSRMIAVIDLVSGEVFHRACDTLTLDVPADLNRKTGVASVDPQSHVHYLATDGKQREHSVFTRPLSWRVHGEECLVADRSRRWALASSCTGVYRLRAV